jgi:AhpD family alkylhydroperoxidase
MRLDYRHELPEASRAMSQLERVVEASTLDPKMRELIKLRASQINGCAYCVDMLEAGASRLGASRTEAVLASRVARERVIPPARS